MSFSNGKRRSSGKINIYFLVFFFQIQFKNLMQPNLSRKKEAQRKIGVFLKESQQLESSLIFLSHIVHLFKRVYNTLNN